MLQKVILVTFHVIKFNDPPSPKIQKSRDLVVMSGNIFGT